MTLKKLTQAYAACTPEEQAQHLARWAHCLTVDARDTYIAGTEAIADPVRLRAFNELLHRLTAQISHALARDPARYPDAVILTMLVDATKNLRAALLAKELGQFCEGSTAAASGRQRRAG